MVIDGKKIASEIVAELKTRPKSKNFLAAFLVGDDPNSLSFLKQKEKTAREIGVPFRLYEFSEKITSDKLRKEIGKVANHKTCGGALIQLPLPENLNHQYILNAIPREKDVDVLGERALGAFYTGRNPILPPAVSAVKTILSRKNLKIENFKTAVVGRGPLVGKPVALWLMGQVAELAVFTSKTENLEKKLKECDLVITGVGSAGLIKPEYLKNGAGVIDFGYEEVDGSLRGDFDSSALEAGSWELGAGFHTPTPGGTGPILVAELLRNFLVLNQLRA